MGPKYDNIYTLNDMDKIPNVFHFRNYRECLYGLSDVVISLRKGMFAKENITVYISDDDGNIYISVQAEKHRNKGGDGQNSPDIRCCCLVYVDPDYSESVMEMSVDPFYDNWRVWSSDIWSG